MYSRENCDALFSGFSLLQSRKFPNCYIERTDEFTEEIFLQFAPIRLAKWKSVP